MTTEPQIVAFLCNWCSYAGADLAGTSRISYPPNIRIIRVMCSGRVDPAFILRALEKGVAGVLVSGCHPGECHYISGNLEAEKRVENTKEILNLLGLGAERLRLEWISASEGEKFAGVIRNFTVDLNKIGPNPLKAEVEVEKKISTDTKEPIWEIVKKTNVELCLECAKCASSCPIARINPDYSPRLIVKRTLRGFEGVPLLDKNIWLCLTCGLCHERCPSDVRYPDFIRDCRAEASKLGMAGACAHGGILLDVSRIMANPEIKQDRLGWLPKGAKVSSRGDILYFVGCLPYFDVVFEDINIRSLEIAQSVIKILNKAGVEPVLLRNERCCGHDLYFTGDSENFEKLAKINVAAIKKTQATKIVTACAECYRTLKLDYAELLGGLDFEILHVSEFLDELIKSEKIRFTGKFENKKVVYHDPCRLGRHMGIYDSPRNVITSIPGMELMEMERSRENALCCGVSAWMNCGKYSKLIQTEKLKEARRTGADWLITSCPKCLIHLKCAMNEKSPVEPEEITMKTCDLSVLAARTMNLT